VAEFIHVDDIWVGENQTLALFTLRLSGPWSEPVSVDWATSAQSASSGWDYTQAGGVVMFAPGEIEKTVPISIVNRAEIEPLEFFHLNLSNAIGATLATDKATAFIVDDDAVAPTPRVTVADVTVDEGDGTANLILRLDAASSSTVTVDFATADGTARGGADFRPVSDAVTFLAGEVVKTVAVELIDDGRRESDENFAFRLTDTTGARIARESATVTLLDNDGRRSASPYVEAGDIWVSENEGIARFIVRLTSPSNQAVGVSWATKAASAASGWDYEHDSGRLTFAPGEVVKTVTVALVDRAEVEPLEAFRLTLSDPSGATILTSEATAFIVDNDTVAPSPRILAQDTILDESAGRAAMVVRLDAASTGLVEVDYTTRSGAAEAGSDFTATEGRLTFLPGEVVKTVFVDVADDGRTEGPESFALQISNARGGQIVQPRGTAVLVDNDVRVPSPTVGVDDVWVSENEGMAFFTVRLSAASGQPATVEWSTAAGTATSGWDFDATRGALTFAPGDVVKTVSVPLVDRAEPEAIESFHIDLTNPVGALLGRTRATATIVDNDATPQASPSASVGPGASTSALEGAGWIDVPIVLSAPSPALQRIAWRTRDGSAEAGKDYQAASGVLAFLPGETVKTVRVLIDDDIRFESAETFRIAYSAPGGSGASPANLPFSTTVTIRDDEVPIRGGAGRDTLRGGPEEDRIYGLDGADRLYGLGGNDRLYGGAGKDLIDGGKGRDLMDGGRGDDVFVVDNARDRVIERKDQGTDLVRAKIDHALGDHVENLTLTGKKDIDGTGNALGNVIRGNSGENRLDGGRGDDRLFGGDGRDVLIGGRGVDVMEGGKGGDTFLFRSGTDAGRGRNADVIRDFERGRDVIDLARIDANERRAGDQAFDFIGGRKFSGDAGELRFDDGRLEGDVDGDGAADFEIVLRDVARLSASDVLL